MRAFSNEKLIKRRARLGQFASWGGLAVLAIGMFISLRSSPGNFLRIAQEDSSLLSNVASDTNGIGFLAFGAATADVRTVSIDGVQASAESIDSGRYALKSAEEALVVVANPQNTWIGEEGVSPAQLAQIFSSRVSTWAEIDPAWPDQEINRYSPPTDSTAFQGFLATIMEPAFGAGEAGQVLLGGADPSYNRWLLISFGCLIAGFIAANIGGYNVRRFGRSPRPDERLAKELKGFDDRYMLFSWMLPAAYVFAGPSGIYTFSVRDQGGKVSNVGNRWRQPFSVFRLLTAFGQEGLGNPTAESLEDAKKMQRYLKSHLPELDAEVQPMVLFLNPEVDLELNSPQVPVVMPKGLKSLLRQRAKQHRIQGDVLQRLETIFSSTPK